MALCHAFARGVWGHAPPIVFFKWCDLENILYKKMVTVTAGLSEQLTLSVYSIFICVDFVIFREVM